MIFRDNPEAAFVCLVLVGLVGLAAAPMLGSRLWSLLSLSALSTTLGFLGVWHAFWRGLNRLDWIEENDVPLLTLWPHAPLVLTLLFFAATSTLSSFVGPRRAASVSLHDLRIAAHLTWLSMTGTATLCFGLCALMYAVSSLFSHAEGGDYDFDGYSSLTALGLSVAGLVAFGLVAAWLLTRVLALWPQRTGSSRTHAEIVVHRGA